MSAPAFRPSRPHRAQALRRFGWSCLLAVTATSLSGCAEEASPPASPVVRAVKTMVISARATTQVRRIAGVTEAGLVTELSFEVGGRIVELNVDEGDAVQKGQRLARLDEEPFQIAERSAKASLASARARLVDAETKLKQQSDLIKRGYTSRQEYETAVAQAKSARSAVDAADSQVSAASRDRNQAQLLSPIAGEVAAKYVEKFTDVSAGQRILQVITAGLQQVNVNVPEGLVRRLRVGDPVQVRFPTLPRLTIAGRIDRIAARAGATNSFPVSVALTEQDPDIRAGLSAEVAFEFETAATGKAFLLPLTAVLPSNDRAAGAVFVFDPQSERLSRRTIEVVNVRDNDLEVMGDIRAGDIVAIAGVSFLTDGLKVKRLNEAP